jgi:hypothetical protein
LCFNLHQVFFTKTVSDPFVMSDVEVGISAKRQLPIRGFTKPSSKVHKGIFDRMERLGMKCPYPCMCMVALSGKKGRPHHKDKCPRQIWADAAQGAFDSLPLSVEPLTSQSPACSTISLAVPKPREGDILQPLLQSISAAKYCDGRWVFITAEES